MAMHDYHAYEPPLSPLLAIRNPRTHILVRLTFACQECGAQQVTDRRYRSVRRLLGRWASNDPVPYLRCPCCRQRWLYLTGSPELIRGGA